MMDGDIRKTTCDDGVADFETGAQGILTARTSVGPQESAARDVRLVYCVGATKSGTGWVYQYLHAHPECHLRALKELHFFDTLEFGLTGSRVRKLRSNMDALASSPELDLPSQRKLHDFQDWVPVAESGDMGAYLGYLSSGRGEKAVVGDVTPAYAQLSVESLKKMLAVVPDTRFIFLMRDPVARLWSHIRMLARRAMRAGAVAEEVAAEILMRAVSGLEQRLTASGAYDAIIPRLKSVVPAGKIYIDFFEDVVVPSSADRLCAFLGIKPHAVRMRQPHKGLTIPLRDDQRARLRDYLVPQYDYVRSEFGRLPAAWEASLAKDS